MIVAHLSDLHLRDRGDAAGFATQLDRIAARAPDHVVITGDLLDRWNPDLLEHALDAIDSRGLLDPERLTLLHGNHDLASSGGHPRQRSDLWRLVARFWDPPPLVAARRRAFYRRVASRAAGVALAGGSTKQTRAGLRLASIDSVPAVWIPLAVSRRHLTLRHAEGAIPPNQLEWLARQRGSTPLIVLIHHYPLPVGSFAWNLGTSGWLPQGLMVRLQHLQVIVRMEIDAEDRARLWKALEEAGATAVLCGHVHRARLERRGRIAVGLNGQSGADWAGRTIAYYRIADTVSVEHESARAA